jgi:hypothetical protein
MSQLRTTAETTVGWLKGSKGSGQRTAKSPFTTVSEKDCDTIIFFIIIIVITNITVLIIMMMTAQVPEPRE